LLNYLAATLDDWDPLSGNIATNDHDVRTEFSPRGVSDSPGVRGRIIHRRESLITGETAMATLILFLAILFAGASLVFYSAGNMAGHGSAWASEICSATRLLCDVPQLAAVAAAGFGGLWIVVKIRSVLRR
jgi:hypothetical protein